MNALQREIDQARPIGGHDDVLAGLTARHVRDGAAFDLASVLRDPALGRVAMVSSFGADSAVLLHMVAQADPGLDVLFIDTGHHFRETLDYVDTLADFLGLTSVRHIRPDATLLAQEDAESVLWKTSPDLCCMLRKTFPLQDALSGYDSWITGRKRFQGATRSALPTFERDGAHIKINPLVHWSAGEILDYARMHALPRHTLVESGYLSIGCAPCTRPVKPGEDPRAGRWSGLDKVECGIHLGGADASFVRKASQPRG